ncbi:MAG: iron ABC transporter permease [Proteobacteria bacterium]|nr:iron ABC transporter permease [Pseudomonadota bacterium]MBU4580970.1 iron ABC transporter permease [Pseudomonadota bacterium]MCG2740267.1 iron ABC transporter permease [Syntrophaceae bacterium]
MNESASLFVNRLGLKLRQPQVILGLLLLVVLAGLVVVPFLQLVHDTAVWQEADRRMSRLAEPGDWTLFHYLRVFAGPLSVNIFYRPLIHSLATSLTIALTAMLLGGLMAWLVVRTDMPFKKTIAVFAVIPYVLPSYTLALAWLDFFKNERIGGAVGICSYLFGVSPPDWLAYGFVPIVITLSLHYYPFTYLLVSGALVSLDSNLEESGEVLGASRFRILRRITFPLMLPALISAFILTFSRAVGTFGTPYFLGAPVRYFTLSTTIYSSIVNRTPAVAYIGALVLILISMVIIYLNQKVIGEKSFVTIAGKGLLRRVTLLGRWRWPAFSLMAALIGIAVFVPLLLLLWQTLMLYPNDYSLGNLTLHYWIGKSQATLAEGESGILRNAQILGSAWNSICLSVIVALVTGMMGILIGYAVVRGRKTRLAAVLEQGSFLPYLIPSIAFGAIYLALFSKSIGPLPPLYGTFLLLVLVCVAKNLPFSARSGISSMMQVAGELEEAGMMAGATWLQRFRRIILPLTLAGSLSGFILAFISTMRELSLIILLITPETRTLTTMTFRYVEQGYSQFADAIILLIVLLVVGGEFLARRIGGKRETI